MPRTAFWCVYVQIAKHGMRMPGVVGVVPTCGSGCSDAASISRSLALLLGAEPGDHEEIGGAGGSYNSGGVFARGILFVMLLGKDALIFASFLLHAVTLASISSSTSADAAAPPAPPPPHALRLSTVTE